MSIVELGDMSQWYWTGQSLGLGWTGLENGELAYPHTTSTDLIVWRLLAGVWRTFVVGCYGGMWDVQIVHR